MHKALVVAVLAPLPLASMLRISIPPSIPLILIVFSLHGMWVNRPVPSQPFDFALLLQALREGVWALLMPVILLGGIYSGCFSAIEAAALALLYALVVEIAVHKEMKRSDFYDVALDASKPGGTLFPLLAVGCLMTSGEAILILAPILASLAAACGGRTLSSTGNRPVRAA